LQNNTIKRKYRYGGISIYLTLLLLLPLCIKAQFFYIHGNKKRVNIRFKLVRNMVVVPLTINGKGPFNFVLDTGVGIMIITDPKLVDSIDLASKRTINLYGLGGDSYEAYVTSQLNIDLPNISSSGVSAAILKKDHFGLSNYAGMHIHGLLGYDFFNNLAVKFTFYDSTMVVTRPRDMKRLRKSCKIPISIEKRKPYLEANLKLATGQNIKSKLIIDLGAGHPLWLDDAVKKYGLPQKFILSNLGVGLTGPIDGFISRVDEIELGKYKLKDVVTSFPYSDSLRKKVIDVDRDGNLGLGLLKRFTMIISYRDSTLYLKPASNLKAPFEYDMSGMEYYYEGNDYTHLVVERVYPGAAADIDGLKKGDEVTAINFKSIGRYTIEQIDDLFRSKDKRSLLLDIYRNKEYSKVILELKKRI